jgi:phenylpropionate dioxygenase-like ring-hydroxylating dioxygenase large terminal subunit
MLSREENDRLTRVGAGTPMGETLRRYWMPCALSSELPENDGAPIRVRLLGEDLVAFRDTEGKVGLVDAFCPHRRAPMFFGRNEECGLRCVYHGWKFDRDGTCVDMPSEPADSLFKTKVTIAAYPTYEAGGFVWAYLGPREFMPDVPDYEFCRVPATHGHASKNKQFSNFAQALEGGLDSVHATILHAENGGDLSFLGNFERLVPRLDVVKTDYGYYYIGQRDIGEDASWVRVYQYLMPFTQMRGTVDGPFRRDGFTPRIDGHIWVPIDDETTCVYHYTYSYDPAVPLSPEEIAASERSFGRGPENLLPDYSLRQNRDNDYDLDRKRQRTTTFSGIEGVNTQDNALQEGMGPIVDRTQERLGTTDRAIIVMRQLLLEATREVEAGRSPRGTSAASYRSVRAADVVIPRDRPWESARPDAVIARF